MADEYQSGLISGELIGSFYEGISSLLGEQIKKYTSSDSSSVKDETASAILCSIYFTIDAYASALQNPTDFLKSQSVKEAYYNGLNILKQCFEQTKQLYHEIVQNRLVVPSVFYNETIDRSLPEFFRDYDIEFHAHVTSYIMDYPVLFDDTSAQGVFYIRQYLEKLKTETQFLKWIGQKAMLKTLFGYCRQYLIDIENTPLNFFEIVLDQMVFSVLTGKSKRNLSVTPMEFDRFLLEIKNKSHREIRKMILRAFHQINADYMPEDRSFTRYLYKYQLHYINRFLRASDNNGLYNLLVLDGYNPSAGKIVFRDGKQQSDEHIASIVDQVEQCQDTDVKIQIITRNIHSIRDYIDILEADCLYGDEFQTAFETLGDEQIAIIGRILFDDELRCGCLTLSPEKLNAVRGESECEWQTYFIDFLFNMEPKKLKNIEKLINSLIYEE